MHFLIAHMPHPCVILRIQDQSEALPIFQSKVILVFISVILPASSGSEWSLPFYPPSSLKSEIFSPQTVICIIVQRSYNISPNLVMNNTQVIQIYMTAHPVCVCVSSLLMYFVVFCRCDSGVSDISLNGFYSVLFAHVKLFAIPTNAHFTSRTIWWRFM